MFIASFQQAVGAPFVTDKNGQLPFIGQVSAGQFTNSIFNGTMFVRGGYQPGQLYLCDNTPNEEYPEYDNVTIIGVVSTLEFVQLRTQLGAAKRVVKTAVTAEAEEAEVV